MNYSRTLIATLSTLSLAATAQAQFGDLDPTIRSGDITRIGEHSHVILDQNESFVPNVGFVVGTEATLVIDTGMGTSNGRIVLEEARSLNANQDFYIAATHYHPEHDLGALAFPASARLVRWTGQQAEIDDIGTTTIERFASFSPVVAELLDEVAYRDADILFSDEVVLDLGGVHVRIIGVGPNHTRGDTVFFVEEDSVLYAGDVIMPVFPAASAEDGSISKWIENMDRFAALGAAVVVPAHGRVLDADSITLYRGYMTSVQAATAGLSRTGSSQETAMNTAAETLAAQFPGLVPAAGSPNGRIVAALSAALREAASQ